ALEGALCDLVGRHESLRTMFPEHLGVPRQEIIAPSSAALRLDVAPVSEADLAAALSAAAQGSVDLAAGLPPPAHGLVLSPRGTVLLLVLHHIAGDGWSNAVLGRDLSRLYAARRNGQATDLPALPVHYADYTLWQRDVLGQESEPDSAIARQLAYWRQ